MRLALIVLLTAGAASAQTAAVRVTTPSASGAAVVIGDAVAGGPGEALAIPAETPVVVALVEQGQTWNPRRAEVTVTVPAGDTLDVGLALPARVRVESLPPGATVTLLAADGTASALGTAPLTADLAPGLTGTLIAALDGYRDARAVLDATAQQVSGRPLTLVLSPDGSADGTPPVTVLTTTRSRRRATLLDAGVAVLTLAAGTVAVVTKFRADRVDDRYRDPASSGARHRLPARRGGAAGPDLARRPRRDAGRRRRARVPPHLALRPPRHRP